MILRQSSQPEFSLSSKSRKLKIEKIPQFTNQLLIAKLNENCAVKRPSSSRDHKIFQDSGSALRKSISSGSQSRHKKTPSTTTDPLEKRPSDNSSENNRGISLSTTRSTTLENFSSPTRPTSRPSFLNFLPSEDQVNLDCPLVKRTSMVLSRESTFSRSSRRTLSSAGGARKPAMLTQNTPRQSQRLSTRGSTLYTCEDTPRVHTTSETPMMLKDPWQSCANFPNGNQKVGKMKQEVMEQEAKRNFLSLNPYNSNKEREIDPERFRPFKIQLFKPLKVVTVYKNEQQNCDPIRELSSRGNKRLDVETEEVVAATGIKQKTRPQTGDSSGVKSRLFSIFEGTKSGGLQNLDFLSWTSPKTLSYSRSAKIKHVHWKQDNGEKLIQKYLDY